MIKINEDWQLERDNHGWVVRQFRNGVNPKTGEATRTSVLSYFPNLRMCLDHVVDVDCGLAEDLDGVLKRIDQIQSTIQEALEQRPRVRRVERRQTVPG